MPTEKIISLNNLDRYDKNLKTVAGILQRSTAYALGDVVHKKNIYLKCTTAGTTKATTLDLTNVAKYDIVTDGTVVWTVTSTTGPASGESSGAGLEDWQANHNYAVDDIYVYEGEIYKTLVKFTSGVTEDSRTEINDIVPSVWASNTEYTAGQIIGHTDVTTLKKVYYNVTSNFTSGATFEVTAEMQELQITEEYVPNPLTHTQINNLINNFVPSGSGTEPIFYNDSPIGTIISYMGITAPKDYLACDGTVYNIADYRELAEYIKRQFGSYNFFGGDGTTTFAVPDLRGEFLRGSGTNSHTNQGSGSNVGVHQDATEHNVFVTGIKQDHILRVRGVDGSGYKQLDTNNRDSVISTLISQQFTVSSSISLSETSDGFYTSRPTNTSVLYCIKYNTSVLSTPENNYSTEEQRIGTWIDGKPLYQKTYVGTIIADSALHPIATLSNNLSVVDVTGYALNSYGSIYPTNVYISGDDRFSVYINSDNAITIIATPSSGLNSSSCYITIKYTKTTD